MKKKILLSSIVTIGLCLCMIAGSTFALFTDTATNNIAVTSGTVDISASLSDLQLYSITDGTDTNNSGSVNLFGDTYYYIEDGYTSTTAFLNGGTASFTQDNDGNNIGLTLTNITPGDRAEFTVDGTNNSNVNTNVRLVINNVVTTAGVDGTADIINNIVVKFGGQTITLAAGSDNSFTSDWIFAGTADFSYTVSVSLPVEAGNECQGESITFDIVLQAVQANEAP